jgi:S1-C subfamily serine protease
MDQSETGGQASDDAVPADGSQSTAETGVRTADAGAPTVDTDPPTAPTEPSAIGEATDDEPTAPTPPTSPIALPASPDAAAGPSASTPGPTPSGLEPARASAAVPVWGPIVTPPTNLAAEQRGNEGQVRRGPGWVWGAVVVAAALVGALIGGGIVSLTNPATTGATVKEISAGPALLNGVTNVETVIGKVLPAIVSIDAKGPAPTSQNIFGSDSSGVEEDQGTGMIISPSGEVVTNNHVIAGATTITVTLYGSIKPLPATLVDTDATNDVALLQISGQSNLPTVTYGNSDNVQVGDAVVAIGNALGLSAGTPTVTQGIISAKGRSVQASDSAGGTSESLTNMFQTDAAINPGNSGGPLVDSSGRVIGMNTAVASSADGTSQAQNIGFAIPANKIGKLLPALRSKSIGNQTASGTGFLGVSLETLTSQIRSEYNFVPTQGAVVLQVQSGSPAATAGLQQGDVITSYQGKPVTSADQLATAIQADKPGQKVTIGLYRGPDQKTVTATLASGSTQGTGG